MQTHLCSPPTHKSVHCSVITTEFSLLFTVVFTRVHIFIRHNNEEINFPPRVPPKAPYAHLHSSIDATDIHNPHVRTLNSTQALFGEGCICRASDSAARLGPRVISKLIHYGYIFIRLRLESPDEKSRRSWYSGSWRRGLKKMFGGEPPPISPALPLLTLCGLWISRQVNGGYALTCIRILLRLWTALAPPHHYIWSDLRENVQEVMFYELSCIKYLY